MPKRRTHRISAAVVTALVLAVPASTPVAAADAASERADRARRAAEVTRGSVDHFLSEAGGLLDPSRTSPERAGEMLRGLARASVPRVRDAKDARTAKLADRATAELIEAADAVEQGEVAAARARITNAITALDGAIDRLAKLGSLPIVPIVGVAAGFPEEVEGIDFEPSGASFEGWFDSNGIAGEITRGGKLSVPGANCRGESGSTFRFHAGTWDPLRDIGLGSVDHFSFFDPAKDADPDCIPLPNDLVERGSFVLQVDPGTGELRGLFSIPRADGLFTGFLVGSFVPSRALDPSDSSSVVVGRSTSASPAMICGTEEPVADRAADLGDLRISFGLDGLVRRLGIGYGDSLERLTIPFGVLVREQMADGTDMAVRIRVAERGETTVEHLDPTTAEPIDGGIPVEVDLDGIDMSLTYESVVPPTSITVDTAAERADGTRVCDSETISTEPPALPAAPDEAAVEQYRRHLDLRLLLDSYRAARRLQRTTGGAAEDRARVLRVFADGVVRDALATNDPMTFSHARTAADRWRAAADELESGDQSRARALLNDGLDALDAAIGRLDAVIEETRPPGTTPFEVPEFLPCGGTCTQAPSEQATG